MSENVETMFYTREKPWHGLGVMVEESPTSKDALHLAGLDWSVEQQPVQTVDGTPLKGFLANVRSTDKKVLGVVTNKYKVVQNEEAFAFTDALLGEGGGLLMKRLVPCRKAGKCGSLRNSPTNI